MLCFYRGLLILYFVLYLYFVFLLLPTWCIKPDDEVDDDDDDDDDDNRFDTPSALRCSDAQTDRQTDKMIYQYRALSILTRNIKL